MKLSLEQRAAVRKAIGDETSWPIATDDPIVNWAVDCAVSGYIPYCPQIYEAEVRGRLCQSR